MSLFNTKILITSKECEKFIDVEFFQNFCNLDYLNIDFYDKLSLLNFVKKVKTDEYDFVFIENIMKNTEVFEKFSNLTSGINSTKFVILDAMHPSANLDKEGEKKERGDYILICDYKLNQFENSIEVPILSVLNQDIITQAPFIGFPHLKYHQISNYHSFNNRNFDIMFKVGKPKPTRVILSASIIKNELKNSYTNISFSLEPGGNFSNLEDFWESLLDNCNYYDLVPYIKKIPIQTFLGIKNTKSNIKYQSDNINLGYTTDISSYSEIYMESVTCELNIIKNYPELIAYTEKTFNNFFYYKIPLAIDTKNNIDYLKKIGFKFPIEPCYIDESDDDLTFYNKVDDWCKNLKNYNFKEMWERMFFKFPFSNPLHDNHLLYREFMQEIKPHRKTIFSKPQYLATYLFIEKYLPNMKDKFINWDFQTYLFLSNKDLI